MLCMKNKNERKMTTDELIKDIEQAEDMDAVKKATLDLIDCIEKYVRQDCSRSTLIWKKEKLKRLLEK